MPGYKLGSGSLKELAGVLDRRQHRTTRITYCRKIPAARTGEVPPGGGSACMRAILCARHTFRHDVDQTVRRCCRHSRSR